MQTHGGGIGRQSPEDKIFTTCYAFIIHRCTVVDLFTIKSVIRPFSYKIIRAHYVF